MKGCVLGNLDSGQVCCSAAVMTAKIVKVILFMSSHWINQCPNKITFSQVTSFPSLVNMHSFRIFQNNREQNCFLRCYLNVKISQKKGPHVKNYSIPLLCICIGQNCQVRPFTDFPQVTYLCLFVWNLPLLKNHWPKLQLVVAEIENLC